MMLTFAKLICSSVKLNVVIYFNVWWGWNSIDHGTLSYC